MRWHRPLNLLAREMAFRAVCRHRQGPRPNILLWCARRGGSTWLLNTLAAHPGMRYVGRPFLTVAESRWRHRVPDLAAAAGAPGSSHRFRQIVGFDGEAERRFEALARDIIACRINIYPALNFRQPYFNRVTDRVVFQMTSATPLAEWFDERFDVATVVLLRHPIPASLSVLREAEKADGWTPECEDFLLHQRFVERYLTGEQVDLAWRIVRDGPLLAQHVLDWTLKMLVPYRAAVAGRRPHWLTLTYEQTVVEPDRVVDALSQHLDLPDVEAMRQQVRRPSRTVTPQTRDRTDDPHYLLRRWRTRIGDDEERQLLEIPHAFGIDLYEPGCDLPMRFLLDDAAQPGDAGPVERPMYP